MTQKPAKRRRLDRHVECIHRMREREDLCDVIFKVFDFLLIVHGYLLHLPYFGRCYQTGCRKPINAKFNYMK